MYLLWWVQERHVPAPLVAAILAAGDLTIAALEIPAGWVADRYGHRVSLLAGSLIQAIGMLACWQGEGFAGLLLASLLVAIGDVFRSGADQALLYRSCVALDREADFQKIAARSGSLQTIALVALILLGGLIVKTSGFAAAWIAEIALSLGGFAVAVAMCEPPAAAMDDEETKRSSRLTIRLPPSRPKGASARLAVAFGGGGKLDPTKNTGRLSRGVALLAVIVPVSLLDAAAGATAFVLQIADGAQADGLTLLVAAITLAEAGGSLIASRLPTRRGVPLVLCVMGAVVVAGAGLAPGTLFFLRTSHFAPRTSNVALAAVAVALALLQGAASPVRAAVIQQMASDSVRARVASLASAVDKALSTISLLCAAHFRI